MNKLATILVISSLLISFQAKCQFTPRASALLLPDSLVFSGTTTISFATVTYNPIANKYYSLRIGNSSFPLQTWNATGGLAIFSDTAGIDSRGIWWNPNTNQVERNCFSSFGWATMNLNGSQNATNSNTTIFTGQHQPTSQSVGAYDYLTNTVLFNSSGVIHIYNRNTGNLISTLPLTGTTLTNINTESVIYTGQTGFEIGVLDYVAKKVLLFNRTTGVFSGSSQLPSSAITHSQFRFSYANSKVWLFNSSLKKWNAYNIWGSPLPVKLLSFTASPIKDMVDCKWITTTEINNDYFTLEKSKDAAIFEEVGKINGNGNSTEVLDYSLIDDQPFPGITYYRLKQTDFDGRFSYSQTVAVNMISEIEITAYPNPASDNVYLIFNSAAESSYEVRIVNLLGKVCLQLEGIQTKGENVIEVNTSHLQPGMYNLQYIENENLKVKLVTIK